MVKDLKPRRSASKGNLTEISAAVLVIDAQVDFLSPTAAFPYMHAYKTIGINGAAVNFSRVKILRIEQRPSA